MPTKTVYWSPTGRCCNYWPVQRLLVAAALCLGNLTAHAEVVDNVRFRFYVVKHQPGETLLAAINRHSPIRQDGQTFHAYTRWQIRWFLRWHEDAANGECRITTNRTEVNAEITLPELKTHDAQARQRFASYLPALQQHELGHFDIAHTHAQRIDQGILQLPTMTSCRILEQTANQLGRRVLDEAIAAERTFDRLTGHGRTQGAWLPR